METPIVNEDESVQEVRTVIEWEDMKKSATLLGFNLEIDSDPVGYLVSSNKVSHEHNFNTLRDVTLFLRGVSYQQDIYAANLEREES
jgi:hypothetical protein